MIRAKKLFLGSLALLSVSLIAFGVFASKKGEPVFAATTRSVDTYYSSITDDMTGSTLLRALQSLNTTKLRRRVGYDSMAGHFDETDPASGGKITAFYSGKAASYSKMNREHVWPASRTVLGRELDPLEDDIHMVRPTLEEDNEDRGNEFFVEGGVGDLYKGWDPANCNNESYRGDAARIVFYCVVADSQLTLVDKVNESPTKNSMGKLSDLIKWNLKYPVKSREQTRNNAAESLQGNRNPFIDHPEYVCRIWGSYNDTIYDLCHNKKIDSISFKLDSDTKEVGYVFRPRYTINPEDASPDLVWSSSDTSVATVGDDGLVTPIAPGTTNIKVQLSNDSSVSDTLVLTVIPSSQSGIVGGCSGSVITNSVILSSISLLCVGVILLRKYKKNEYEEK